MKSKKREMLLRRSPSETKDLRARVVERADGKCEACGRFVDAESGHLDHFHPRGKVPQTLWTCWFLCVECDTMKTLNKPSAAYWLERWVKFCDDHRADCLPDVAEARERAEARLLALRVKFGTEEK